MQFRREYLLFVLLFIGVLPLLAIGNKAQTNPSVQIQQPSSSAQSLGEFAEIPVDLYTGRTKINIPLFTISYNDIEVPVSLSYHGGGIKVDDECGVVGLGWTLNAGGVVNRIVRGMPDELFEQGEVAGYGWLRHFECIGEENKYHDFLSIMTKLEAGRDPSVMIEQPTSEELNLLRWMEQYGKQYDEGHFDTSPDNFLFSVQGLSGAFVNGKAAQAQTNTGCRITQKSDSFRINAANGLTYHFGELEQQYYPYKVATEMWLQKWENLEERKCLYTSAWWLTSIQSPAGDVVEFSYDLVKKRQRYPNSYFYTQYLDRIGPSSFKYDCNFLEPHNYFMDTVHHQHKRLTTITTPNACLKFHYAPPSIGNDICRVDSISLYTKKTNDSTLIERYVFMYNGSGDRAKLIGLVRQGRNGNTQHYNFSYNSSLSVEGDNKDHWGYYSRESKGTFPNMNYLNLIPQEIPRNRVSTRHADNGCADNNTLASITYPSGLKVKLTWESHDFSKWSAVGEGAHKDYAYNRQPQLIYDTVIQNQFELCGKLNQEVLSKELYLSPGSRIYLDLSHYFYDSSVQNFMHCVMHWQHHYQTNEPPFFSIQFNGSEIFYSPLDSLSVRPNYVDTKVRDLVLSYGSGNYKFLLGNPRSTLRDNDGSFCTLYNEEFNRPETQLGRIFVKIIEVTSEESPTQEYNVGGVRIKQIDYSDNNTIFLCKRYSYTDSLGQSTGVLSYPPRYASSYKKCMHKYFEPTDIDMAPLKTYDEPEYLVLRSNGLPYTLNGSGHIEYEQVNEVTIDLSNDSSAQTNRTEYYYRTSATRGCSDVDDTGYYTSIPADMLQLTSKKHQREHLWKKVEYTDERKVTEYAYNVLEKEIVDTITGALFPIADFQEFDYGYEHEIENVNINPYKNFGIVRYRVIPYNKRLVSQQTTGEQTNTYHAYTYANNSYSSALNADMPITHTFVTSKGDTLIEHYTYESNTNKIKQCIITKNGYVIDGYQLDYDQAYRITKKYRPDLASDSLTTIPNLEWELLESYNYYSNINRIKEVIDHKTLITTTYLWSYGGTYPIAVIENSSFVTIQNRLGDINNLQNSYAPDISPIDNLRSLLPDARIITMTYEPLVGMTSYTDAKGYTLYYEYDDFGQIKEIYESANGVKKILKHFDYQFENQ